MPKAVKDEITPTRKSPFALTRGHNRWQVIRDLADGMSTREAAERWGVSSTGMHAFAKNNAAEIKALQQEVIDEFKELWVSSKFLRLAEYQQTLEDIESSLETMLQLGSTLGAQDMALIKEKRSLLRNVAEELGQLPSRNNVQVTGASVSYNFDGITPGDLS